MRKTLSRSTTFVGHGIGTGYPSELHLQPGDNGFQWKANGHDLGPPTFNFAGNTTVATFSNGSRIACVEHLLAAAALQGVTDMIVDLCGGPEIPFLDGSAVFFYDAMHPTSSLKSTRLVSPLNLSASVAQFNNTIYLLSPSTDQLAVTVVTDFPSPLGYGTVTLGDIPPRELATARTFLRDPIDRVPLEIATSRLRGLSRAIEDHAIILWATTSILTPLRLPAEWRYHKLLDLLGDTLGCLRRPLVGKLTAIRPGHASNHALRTSLKERVRS